jgi:hypothetical protein
MALIQTHTRSSKERKIGFFDLSGEIRNQIYRILFVDSYPIDIAPPLWKRSKKLKDLTCTPNELEEYPVSLFRVNKQLHHEAASVFYSENTFQLSILYPNLSEGGCLPPDPEFGLENSFAVLALRFQPRKFGSLQNSWQFQCYDRTVWRWNYIMPSGKRSRSSIERQAQEDGKTTEMYWPSERYRRMVKRLRIQFFVGNTYWIDFQSFTFMSVAVRSSLATLFEGILNKAHVELAIWATEIDPSTPWSDDEFRNLKRIMIAFTPLAKAMTLMVTTNDGLEGSITKKRCTELRAAIRRHAKNPKFERPPWKSRW